MNAYPPAPPLSRAQWQGVCAVLASAFGIRLGVFLLAWWVHGDFSPFYVPDSKTYVGMARTLWAEGIFPIDGSAQLLRTPGYPLLLVPGVALGQVEVVTIVLQCVVSTATVFAVFLTAHALFAAYAPAIIAAGLYTIEPLSIVYSSYLLTETLFTACIALLGYLLIAYLQRERTPCLVGSALALVGAILTRPTAMYLSMLIPLGLIVYWVLSKAVNRERLAHALVFALIAYGAVVLWQLRNYVVADYFVFSPISAVNLYDYHASSVISAKRGIPFVKRLMDDYVEKERPELGPPPTGSKSDYYEWKSRTALTVIVENPGTFAKVYVRGLVSLLRDNARGDIARLLFPRLGMRGTVLLSPAFLALLLQYYLAFVLGVAHRRTLDIAHITLLLIAAYLFLLSGGVTAYGRFRHPLMSIVAVFAGYGYVRAWPRVRRSASEGPGRPYNTDEAARGGGQTVGRRR